MIVAVCAFNQNIRIMRRQMTSPFWGADILTEEFVTNVANSNREYTRRYDQFGPMPHDYRGSDKIYIYAWYWRGEWAGPTKDLYCVLYRPKTTL